MNKRERLEDIRNNLPVSAREYASIHWYIRYHFNHEKVKCENPKCSGRSKNLQWALIHGKSYERKRENFMVLCGSCHVIYDLTDKVRARMNKHKKKAVYQLTMNGEVVRRFDSVREASKQTGYGESCISHHLHGDSTYTQKIVNGSIIMSKWKLA